MSKVVHCKKEKYDVYIGRPSKWGNCFTHLKHLGGPTVIVDTREEAVSRYEEWLREQPDLMLEVKRELKGKVLGCWCSPLACHGEVLVRIANEEDETKEPEKVNAAE